MSTMLLCDECPKTFVDKTSLRKHRSYHRNKILYCNVCKENFTSKSEFITHYYSHKEHQCGECGKTFSHRSNLAVNSRMKKSTLKCPYCDKNFEDVIKEETDESNVENTSEVIRAGFCSTCCKQFKNIKLHMKIHKNIFEC